MSWDKSKSELQADAAEVVAPPHRSRKRTAKWCKGRAGQEHQPVIAIPPNHSRASWSTPCGWRNSDAESWPYRSWYACAHAELCEVCGKILRHYYAFGDSARGGNPDCPDFTPLAP